MPLHQIKSQPIDLNLMFKTQPRKDTNSELLPESDIFEIKSFVKELCCDGVFKAREITKEILLLCGKKTTFLTLQSRR